MASRWHVPGLGCALLLALVSGCGYFSGNSAGTDEEFADLDIEEIAKPKPKALIQIPAPESATPAIEPAAHTTPGELGFHWNVGDRFPLKKILDQRLTQQDSNGTVMGFSRVELLMSLAVEQIREGQTRLAVKYHQVHYREQDLEGQQIEYNSVQPARVVPPQAWAYAGMVDNGFSFWIGPDNRLVDLVGFKDFLQRCAREIPLEQRQAVLAQLSSTTNENGIASFIDDSIGLLPVSSQPGQTKVTLQEGAVWKLPVRNIDGPVPMHVETTCKVKGIQEHSAEIDLFGSIPASRPVVLPEGWKISILGGRCLGSCTVDRQTGIPTHSLVQRVVDLRLETPDGSEIKQRKEIVSSISAFLNQPQKPAAEPVTPANHVTGAPPEFRQPEASQPDVRRRADQPESTGKNRRSNDELRLFR